MIRIINTETLAEVRTIASHADWVTAIAYSDDGTRLVSASRDKSAKVYDGATGELLSSYLGHGAAVRGVSILADNKQVHHCPGVHGTQRLGIVRLLPADHARRSYEPKDCDGFIRRRSPNLEFG